MNNKTNLKQRRIKLLVFRESQLTVLPIYNLWFSSGFIAKVIRFLYSSF